MDDWKSRAIPVKKDDWKTRAIRVNDTGPAPMNQDDYASEMGAQAWSTLAEPLGTALSKIDAYTGAPLRAAGKAFQQGKDLGDVAKAGYEQLGEDPTKAPTMKDIFAKAGVSTEESIPFVTVENPFSPTGRFKHQNISPAGLAGGLSGAAVDPTAYIPGTKWAAAIANKVGRPAIKKGLEIAAHSLTSVRPEDFNYYLKHHERLKGKRAEGATAISDEILKDAEMIRGERDRTKQALTDAENNLKNEAAKLKHKLSTNEVIGADDVDAWHAALEADKIIQGELSAKADAALASKPITAPTDFLKDLLDQEINNYPTITPGYASIRNTLQTIRKGLDENYSEFLNGPQLRDWMRTVRDEINFVKNKGEYTSEIDQSLKRITGQVSDSLKRTVPEYKKLMDQMSQRAEATDSIIDYFRGKDETKGMRSLRLSLSPDSGLRDIVNERLRNYARTNNYPELVEMLDSYENIRATRNQLEEQGYETGLPRLQQNILDLQSQADLAEENAYKVRKFTDDSTRTAVENLGMFHGGRDPYQKNLADLEQLVPNKNYAERIRDEGVLSAFNKERPMGARATAGFGAAGAWLGSAMAGPPGGLLGTALGGLGGMVVDKSGGKIARKGIDAAVAMDNFAKSLVEKIRNPSEKFAPYAKALNAASAGGPRLLLVYHHILWNNDPKYRQAFQEQEE